MLAAGMQPILCVGESYEERRKGIELDFAVGQVHDVTRDLSDEEAAKRKAEEEAAEPQQSQNVQRQTAGTGQGRAQRQESVQTPSTTQRRQPSSTPSAPSWSVPSETDDGGMPDTDPGL